MSNRIVPSGQPNCIVVGPPMCGKTHHSKELAKILGCVGIVEGDYQKFRLSEWISLKTPLLILTNNYAQLPDYMRDGATVREFHNLKERLERATKSEGSES